MVQALTLLHLEGARIVFIYFSSAFDFIHPRVLAQSLRNRDAAPAYFCGLWISAVSGVLWHPSIIHRILPRLCFITAVVCSVHKHLSESLGKAFIPSLFRASSGIAPHHPPPPQLNICVHTGESAEVNLLNLMSLIKLLDPDSSRKQDERYGENQGSIIMREENLTGHSLYTAGLGLGVIWLFGEFLMAGVSVWQSADIFEMNSACATAASQRKC